MEKITFAFTAVPGPQEWQTRLLAESIRTFGGALSGSEIVALVPQALGPLSAATVAQLQAWQVQVVPFAVETAVLQFPFAAKVIAAAEAETAVAHGLLVWLDRDSFVVQEPAPLRLPSSARLGYRPVDHRLIGSPVAQPPDPFWQLIYERCGVEDEPAFVMKTSVKEEKIRPYVNAGMLVVHPGDGLLQAWRDAFLRLYRQPKFTPFYEQDVRIQIFMHQAVLAGTLLARLQPAEWVELPHRVNYPLHMHTQYPPQRRPRTINELITGRYDTFFTDSDWRNAFPVTEPLAGWLAARIA